MSLESTFKMLEHIQKGAGGDIPIRMVHEELDKLPKEVWNSKTTFLETQCESSLYLCGIFDRLMECDKLIKEFPNKQERAEHIFKNQLFGIAVDDFKCIVSQRTLYGYIGRYDNIKCIENYSELIKNKNNKIINKAIKNRFGKKKFDVIIAKPTNQQIEEWKQNHKK